MINLQPFCGKNDVHFWLNAPFSEGDFTYATNGHILVRVERRTNVPEQDKMNGKFAKMFADNPVGELIEIPTLPKLETVQCDECDFGCSECDGGFAPKFQYLALGDSGYQVRYLKMIADLPNGRISPNGLKCAPFTFDGGDGLLMPCRRP